MIKYNDIGMRTNFEEAVTFLTPTYPVINKKGDKIAFSRLMTL